MGEDTQRVPRGDAAGPSEVEAMPPASLDPRSASCWIPAGLFGLFLLSAVLLFQHLISITGPMAIASVRNAVTGSGLAEADREALLDETLRLESAMEAGRIDAQAVTRGVASILETPLIPLLALEDVRLRRIPASGLADEEKAEADAALRETAALRHAELIRTAELIDVLGPVAVENEPAEGEGASAAPPLDDDELRALVARAKQTNDAVDLAVEGAAEPRPIDRELLLERLAAEIDRVLAAE